MSDAPKPSSFYAPSDFPAAERFTKTLLARFDELRDDGVRDLFAGRFKDWPEPINRGGWSVHGSKWQGQIINPALVLSGLVADPLIWNAGYSFMAPGASIAPHSGYTSDVLRLHLGLVCPEGDCALRVGQDVRHWRNGEFLLFDDMDNHEAWNRTAKGRLVLIMDLRREHMKTEEG